MRAIDRRSFLALGLGAAAWSCTRGKKKASSGDQAISIVVTAQTGMAAGDTRNGIAVFRGQTPFVPNSLAVRLVPPNGQPFEVTTQREHIEFGSGGSEPATQVNCCVVPSSNTATTIPAPPTQIASNGIGLGV